MLCIIATLAGESSSSIKVSAFPWLGNQITDVFSDNSYGKMQLTVDWTKKMVQLPGNAAHYLDADDQVMAIRTHRDARTAAKMADYNVAAYDWVVVFVRKFWGAQFSWTGYDMNAKYVLMGAGGTKLLSHELAHVLRSSTNLYHNTFLHVEPGSTNPFLGQVVKYGDGFFILGGQKGPNETAPTQLFGFHRLNVGWLDHENVPRVTTSGTYEIARIDSDPGGQVMALRIPRDRSELFVSWVNYHGDDALLVHQKHAQFPAPRLLNMNPGNPSKYTAWLDAGLAPGQTFKDPGSGISIEFLGFFEQKARVFVAYDQPVPPDLPVLDLVSPIHDAVNMVGTVKFELTAYQGKKVNGHNVTVDVFLRHDSPKYEPVGEGIPGLKATWSFDKPPYAFEYDFENPGEELGVYKLVAVATDKTTGKKSRMRLQFFRDDGS